MANPTTNFGWVMPTNTDLVTDLPADFAVFGQGVDTSLADLNGGTTGQILSKTSNTNLDFTWVSANPGDITGVTAGVGISGGGTSGDVTVTNSMATAITTAGDLIKGTGSGTFDRLGIGSTSQVLTVVSGAPAWVTPGGGKVVQIVSAITTTEATSSSSSYADTGLTATITPTSASNKVLVFVNQNGCGKSSANIYQGLYLQLVRGATQLNQFAVNSLYTETALRQTGLSFSTSYLDSPATTSATIYKTQFKSGNGTASVNVQGDSCESSIILMEVTP